MTGNVNNMSGSLHPVCCSLHKLSVSALLSCVWVLGFAFVDSGGKTSYHRQLAL